jgi:hypothetical protein
MDHTKGTTTERKKRDALGARREETESEHGPYQRQEERRAQSKKRGTTTECKKRDVLRARRETRVESISIFTSHIIN